MLQLHAPSPSIKPPPSSPISLPPFSQGKKVLKCNPPLPFPLMLDCFYHYFMTVTLTWTDPVTFIHILKFEYIFLLQLHDFQLYVTELFRFCFSLCGVLIPSF